MQRKRNTGVGPDQRPQAGDPGQLPLWGGGTSAGHERQIGRAGAAVSQAESDHLWSIQDVGHFLQVPVATIYQWRPG